VSLIGCVYLDYYFCLIGRVYVFYVGYVDTSSLYETLFHCNILGKHHYHHFDYLPMTLILLLGPYYRYLIFIYSEFHRGINGDHGINGDEHSKPRKKCKYSICTCFVVLSVNLH
jgi:hypothetical protein